MYYFLMIYIYDYLFFYYVYYGKIENGWIIKFVYWWDLNYCVKDIYLFIYK